MKTQKEELVHRAYLVLGIDRDATEDEIKFARKKILMKNHPDRNLGDAHAENLYLVANESYDFISGKTRETHFLRDDSFISLITNTPLNPLNDLPSYEDWRQKQFYGSDGTIWPD